MQAENARKDEGQALHFLYIPAWWSGTKFQYPKLENFSSRKLQLFLHNLFDFYINGDNLDPVDHV